MYSSKYLYYNFNFNLQLNFDFINFFCRYAQAKFHLKDYEGALHLCDDALKKEPKNYDLSKLRDQSKVQLEKQTTLSNQMFKGIFNKN